MAGSETPAEVHKRLVRSPAKRAAWHAFADLGELYRATLTQNEAQARAIERDARRALREACGIKSTKPEF